MGLFWLHTVSRALMPRIRGESFITYLLRGRRAIVRVYDHHWSRALVSWQIRLFKCVMVCNQSSSLEKHGHLLCFGRPSSDRLTTLTIRYSFGRISKDHNLCKLFLCCQALRLNIVRDYGTIKLSLSVWIGTDRKPLCKAWTTSRSDKRYVETYGYSTLSSQTTLE